MNNCSNLITLYKASKHCNEQEIINFCVKEIPLTLVTSVLKNSIDCLNKLCLDSFDRFCLKVIYATSKIENFDVIDHLVEDQKIHGKAVTIMNVLGCYDCNSYEKMFDLLFIMLSDKEVYNAE